MVRFRTVAFGFYVVCGLLLWSNFDDFLDHSMVVRIRTVPQPVPDTAYKSLPGTNSTTVQSYRHDGTCGTHTLYSYVQYLYRYNCTGSGSSADYGYLYILVPGPVARI